MTFIFNFEARYPDFMVLGLSLLIDNHSIREIPKIINLASHKHQTFLHHFQRYLVQISRLFQWYAYHVSTEAPYGKISMLGASEICAHKEREHFGYPLDVRRKDYEVFILMLFQTERAIIWYQNLSCI